MDVHEMTEEKKITVIDGVTCYHPEEVLKFKLKLNRVKDQSDIKALQKYFSSGIQVGNPMFEIYERSGWALIAEEVVARILKNADQVYFKDGEIRSIHAVYTPIGRVVNYSSFRCTTLSEEDLKEWFKLQVKRPVLKFEEIAPW